MFLQAKTSKFIIIVGLLVGLFGSLKFLYIDNKSFLNGELSRGQIVGRDFLHSWTAIQLASEGKFNDIYNPDLLVSHAPSKVKNSGVAFNFVYPPQTLAFLLPLAKLDYIVALVVWSLFSLILYTLCIKLATTSNLAFCLLLAPTTFLNLSMGQNGLVTGALLVLGLCLIEKYPKISGVLIGILTIKPHLGILIPIALIVGKYKETFIWAVISSITLFAISTFAFGMDVWRAWIDNTPWIYAKNFIEHGTGIALFMQPSPFMSIRLLFDNLSLAWGVQIISAIIAILSVIYAFRKPDNFQLKISVIITATYLVSPYIHSYDMAALSIVIIWQLQNGINNGFIYGEQILLIILWLMPLTMTALGFFGWPITPILILMLLFLLIFKLDRQNHVIDL